MSWENPKPNIYTRVWRRGREWAYLIERRGSSYASWGADGFETEEAARAIMNERVKSVE